MSTLDGTVCLIFLKQQKVVCISIGTDQLTEPLYTHDEIAHALFFLFGQGTISEWRLTELSLYIPQMPIPQQGVRAELMVRGVRIVRGEGLLQEIFPEGEVTQNPFTPLPVM